MPGEPFLGLALGFTVSVPVFVVAMACSIAGARILPKMWDGPFWEGVWPSLDPWDMVRLRTSSSFWNDPGKYGPHGERLPYQEGAGGSHAGSTARGVRADWSAPSAAKMRLDQAAVSLRIWETCGNAVAPQP